MDKPDPTKYPKWKYHKELDAVVVGSPEEEDDLGGGWEDTPAAHGVITAPSAEQSRKMKIEAAAKDENVYGDFVAKRKPGRPKAEE